MMPTFQYVASSGAQSRIKGSIAADTARHARDLLRSRGYRIDDLQETREQSKWLGLAVSRKRLATSHAATVTRELATLVTVGITLAEAIDTLASQHRGRMRRSLLVMQQSVLAGVSFAESMQQVPELFEDVDVSIARMGEGSGDLGLALHEIADFKEAAGQFQDKVFTALMYPAIVLLMAVGVTLFLMTSVVPSLLDTLTEAGKELPLATQIVKGISDALIEVWWALVGGTVAVVLTLAVWIRTEKGRLAFDGMIVRVPVLGSLLLQQSIARIAFTVATLIRSGVSLIDALEIAGQAVGNRVLQASLQRARDALKSGRDLKRSLGAEQLIPPMVVQIFSVGQESGRLDDMLFRLAKELSRQVASASERMTRLLDPIIIVVLAFFVGFIAFATILPIMEMGNVL